MGFFDLEDSAAVMPFTLRLLKVLGLRGSRWDYMRYQFAVFWICFVTLIPKTFLGYRNDIGLIIRGVSELIFHANIVIKMVIFAWKRDEFEKMLTILRKCFRKSFNTNYTSKQSSDFASCNRANDLFSKGYLTYLAVVVNVYNVVPVIQSTIIYINYGRDNNTEPMELRTHMEQEFYWLDIRTNFVHYGCFSASAILTYLFAAYMMVVEASVTYCCCKCCSHMFDGLSIRLSNLSTFQGEKQRGELKEIIEMHVDTLRCIELWNEIRSFALMVQIVNCVLMWCLMAWYLTTNFNYNAINLLILFIVMTCETYGFCFLGTDLSQKNLNLQKAIYEFPWYEALMGIRKSLLRMLQRAQKHVGTTAAGFWYVDIERFGKLVQTSYQIYVVMKDSL